MTLAALIDTLQQIAPLIEDDIAPVKIKCGGGAPPHDFEIDVDWTTEPPTILLGIA